MEKDEEGGHMTLPQFLHLTSATPPADVRDAMVVALAIEPARTRDARARFYCRVVLALGLTTEGPDARSGGRQMDLSLSEQRPYRKHGSPVAVSTPCG